MHIAATYERIGITKLLLESGADVNIQDDNNRLCYDGNTAIHNVASSDYSDVKTVELLLKYNFDINILNSKGETPISLALKGQRKADVFLTFLVYGATLNEDDRNEINKVSDFFNCLTAFEQIKEENPYLRELIINSRNKRKIGHLNV